MHPDDPMNIHVQCVNRLERRRGEKEEEDEDTRLIEVKRLRGEKCCKLHITLAPSVGQIRHKPTTIYHVSQCLFWWGLAR